MGLLGFLKREFSFFAGNYRIIVISWMIMDLAMELPTPNFQYFVQALGGAELAWGIIGLAGFLGMAAVAFPGGYLADKYGRRWLITTMTFVMALSHLLLALAPTWHFILLGTIVSSLALIYQPALFAIVQDSMHPERRGIGSSIIQLIHSTFSTPSPIIAGLLLLQFGLVSSMRIIYLTMTVLFFIAAIWRLRLKETLTGGDPIRFSYFISSYPKAVRESFDVWKHVPRSMFWLFLSQVLVMFGWSLTNVINAIYARDVLGIPQEQWWFVFVPLLITVTVTSIPIGKLVDKVGRRKPLILGLVVLAIATALFINGNLPIVMVSMSLFGIAQLLVMSSTMALSTDLVRLENRGKVNGFINFMAYIVSGFGMLLGNILYLSPIPQLPFFVAILLVVPALLFVLFLIREPKKHLEIQPTQS